jgi:hypothetical protein
MVLVSNSAKIISDAALKASKNGKVLIYLSKIESEMNWNRLPKKSGDGKNCRSEILEAL